MFKKAWAALVARFAGGTDEHVEPLPCQEAPDAAWMKHASPSEKKSLDELRKNLSALQARMQALTAERTLIMNRCIKRMRRSQGKN